MRSRARVESGLADFGVGDVLVVEDHAREQREETRPSRGRLARRELVLVEVVLRRSNGCRRGTVEQSTTSSVSRSAPVAEHRDERRVTTLGAQRCAVIRRASAMRDKNLTGWVQDRQVPAMGAEVAPRTRAWQFRADRLGRRRRGCCSQPCQRRSVSTARRYEKRVERGHQLVGKHWPDPSLRFVVRLVAPRSREALEHRHAGAYELERSQVLGAI